MPRTSPDLHQHGPVLLRWLPLILLLSSLHAAAQQRHAATGLVLSVDRAHHIMVVSTNEMPGYMDAMVMPFTVTDAKSLEPLARGAQIEFTLVVDKDSSHAEDVKVRSYDSAEREPSKASRLQGLQEALRVVHRLKIGQAVPDFALTDQQNRTLHFHQLAGKVIALNFVYTRCALPEYCFRSSNNFAAIQKQYQKRLGKDLELITVTFDPVHDQPGVLRDYAKTWKADPETWHFLTGPVSDVERVCDLFGVNYVPDEGLFVHSLHTAVIDREGKLAVNLEGNEFTAQQFADLVGTVLDSK
jgi:protein SCO1/2